MAASALLTAICEQLSRVAPVTVVIDLMALTFASATLPNFVTDLHYRLPAATTISLCRATATVQYVLQVTGMEHIATLRADLPGSPPPLTPARRTEHCGATG